MTDHLREETIESSVAFHGRLLKVWVDTVRLPNGRTSTREVVAHPGAVAMVPLYDADHVLLVRQWRHPAGRALLEIPAGTLDAGEDPCDCAVRELMEEIGYRPQLLTRLADIFLAPGYSSECLHLFLAEQLSPERLAHDEDETIDTVCLDWHDIETLIAHGEINDAKTLAGLLLAQHHLQRRMDAGQE